MSLNLYIVLQRSQIFLKKDCVFHFWYQVSVHCRLRVTSDMVKGPIHRADLFDSVLCSFVLSMLKVNVDFCLIQRIREAALKSCAPILSLDCRVCEMMDF